MSIFVENIKRLQKSKKYKNFLNRYSRYEDVRQILIDLPA